MTTRIWTVPLAIALAFAAPRALAAPSEQDRAEAQQLVVEAKKLARDGDLKKAVKKYKRADHLVPQVAFKLAIGKLLLDLGDFVAAGAALREAQEEKAIGAAELRAQGDAKAVLEDVERRTPRLLVDIFKPDASKVTVSVDDAEIEAGKSLAVNPGKHEVLAIAAGYQDWQKTVRIDEREKKSVEINMRPAGAAGAAPEADEEKAEDRTTGKGETKKRAASGGTVPKWAAWGAWGLTAASLGIGVGFGVVAIQTTNQVLADYNCLNGTCPGKGFEGQAQNAKDDLAAAKLNGNVSTAFFVVTGVTAVGASVLTYFAFKKSDKAESRTQVVPLVAPGFVGAQGCF